jgi:hypothetical protein
LTYINEKQLVTVSVRFLCANSSLLWNNKASVGVKTSRVITEL